MSPRTLRLTGASVFALLLMPATLVAAPADAQHRGDDRASALEQHSRQRATSPRAERNSRGDVDRRTVERRVPAPRQAETRPPRRPQHVASTPPTRRAEIDPAINRGGDHPRRSGREGRRPGTTPLAPNYRHRPGTGSLAGLTPQPGDRHLVDRDHRDHRVGRDDRRDRRFDRDDWRDDRYGRHDRRDRRYDEHRRDRRYDHRRDRRYDHRRDRRYGYHHPRRYEYAQRRRAFFHDRAHLEHRLWVSHLNHGWSRSRYYGHYGPTNRWRYNDRYYRHGYDRRNFAYYDGLCRYERNGNGAAIGALLGAVIGGAAAGDDNVGVGILLGAGFGAVLGSSLDRLDQCDQVQYHYAMNYAFEHGQPYYWANPYSGVRGTVVIRETYYQSNVECRTGDAEIYMPDGSYNYERVRMCRDRYGDWQVAAYQ
ncbi:hypothetical protein [Maricaulis sp. CAU 1757]